MWCCSLLRRWSPPGRLPVCSRCLSKVCHKYRPVTRKGAKQPNLRNVQIGKNVADIFSRSGMVAVFHFNDLNSREWIDLRLNLARDDITLQVIPSKVSILALQATKFRNITVLFKGCTVIAYGDDSKVSQLLATTKVEHKLHLLGGVVSGTSLLTAQGLQDYADLPSQEQLHLRLIGSINLAQSALAATLQAAPLRLADLLSRLQRQADAPEQS